MPGPHVKPTPRALTMDSPDAADSTATEDDKETGTPVDPKREMPLLREHGRRRWTAEGSQYIQRLPLESESNATVRLYLHKYPETEKTLKKHNRGPPWSTIVELATLVMECRRAARRRDVRLQKKRTETV